MGSGSCTESDMAISPTITNSDRQRKELYLMWISVGFLCYHKTFSTMRFFVDSDSDECAAEQHNCNVRKPRRVNYFHFDSVQNGSLQWKSAKFEMEA